MRKSPRPRVVVDIQKNISPFSEKPAIVNLRPQRKERGIFIRSAIKNTIILSAIIALFLGTASAPVLYPTPPVVNAVTQEQEEERKRLEDQLAEYEQQIVEYEQTINAYQVQGKSLSSEIWRLEANISKINLQIKAIKISLRKLDQEIEDTKADISETEQGIARSRGVLMSLIQNIYEQDSETIMEILIKNPRLSDFFGSVNDLIAVQDSVRASLEQIIELRKQLIVQEEYLAEERLDVLAMSEYQVTQQKKIQKIQEERKDLLATTKGEESRYKELLEEAKKTAAEIRSQIFKLLGGGELTFGEAYKIASFAEASTNIRAAFILAVLSQESAINGIIGKNLGQCYYNDPRNNKSGTVMKDSQKDAFLEITRSLTLDPDTTPVSCPIPRDGAYGGAMGPAQFMPTTWDIFKKRIASITGGNPPSPFNNADAFVGTALYLKDAYNSSSCKKYAADYANVSPEQLLRERCAAARYYAGGNWWNYRWIYGEPVVERASRFQNDIDILNG